MATSLFGAQDSRPGRKLFLATALALTLDHAEDHLRIGAASGHASFNRRRGLTGKADEIGRSPFL
jgi:hypothetical protein